MRSDIAQRHCVLLLIGSISTLFLCCHCEFETNSNANETSAETEDDVLISELLEAPIGLKNGQDQASDVSKILKVLEVAELATSTTSRTTSTAPTTTSTTPRPSPFFNTERPRRYPSHQSTSIREDESLLALDEMMSYLNKTIQVTQEHPPENSGDGLIEHLPVPQFPGNHLSRRRSDHDLPADELFWHTAQAMWDVSSPAFYCTKPGRKISLVKETVKLPFRTIGAIKHKIHDLVKHPYARKRSSYHYPWDHHHHGWGWDGSPVYVKYEPENSLFKLWLRFLYKSVKPALITKIRFKRKLIALKLRKLRKLIKLLKLLKSVKLLKTWAIIKKIVEEIAAKLKPEVVVLKEAGHVHGWGWGSSHQPPPPPPPPSPPPPPANQGWGWPPANYGGWGSGRHDISSSAYGPPSTSVDMTYGPPAQLGYAHQQTPSASYGSPVAYKPENTYFNYNPPSDWLTAPAEQQAQGSDPEGTINAEVDAPSYAKYLNDFGINPLSLSESPSIKNLPQSDKNEEEVPYIVSEQVNSDSKKGVTTVADAVK